MIILYLRNCVLQVEREIRIHSQLRHKYVVRLYAAFEDSENIYLAQEFASGELQNQGFEAHKTAETDKHALEWNISSVQVTSCVRKVCLLECLGIVLL